MANTRTALVTGAAHGIGRATVEALLARGWTVGAYDVDDAGLATLHGERLVTGHLDVTSAEDWERALGALCGDGGLDLLHNNAGILTGGLFEDIPLERNRQIVETNVLGVLTGCQLALPYLKRTHGLVVNMASASAIHGQPELAAYSASKFAVRGLTEALDLEWARHGVEVRDLWPLFVDTAMVEGMDIESGHRLGIRLRPDDVVRELLGLVDDHDRRGTTGGRAPLLRSVHRPVGRQAKVLGALAQVSPTWTNRLTNKLISKV